MYQKKQFLVGRIIEQCNHLFVLLRKGDETYRCHSTDYYKDSYDGEEILSELKELENFNILVVVLTSISEEEKLFLEKEFNEYLEKVLTQEQAETLMVEILKKK